jgi:hypothetical protein
MVLGTTRIILLHAKHFPAHPAMISYEKALQPRLPHLAVNLLENPARIDGVFQSQSSINQAQKALPVQGLSDHSIPPLSRTARQNRAFTTRDSAIAKTGSAQFSSVTRPLRQSTSGRSQCREQHTPTLFNRPDTQIVLAG